MSSLIAWLVICALMYGAGWVQGHHKARVRERKVIREFAELMAERHKLAADNRFLEEWCNRFRDLYLGAVTQIDPAYGAQLRKRWADTQAPHAVQRMLRRSHRG